ncbi:MAG TPA: deoxyribonuclease IV [Bacteroidota bacterium]
MTHNILLGSHMSISGGMYRAFERAALAGCTTMQVFTKNNNRWEARPYTPGDIEQYRLAAASSPVAPVLAHAAYLINLCAVDGDVLKKSRVALRDELERCEALGILGLILHPGSHVGAGENEGIKRIAESLNLAHAYTPKYRTRSILETTAGQGSAIGYRFEQLAGIIDLIDEKDRMSVCFDTCHAFAAGYDISTEGGWNETIGAFDDVIGLRRMSAIHVNDSRKELGSRVDRHDHIGKGRIGLAGFRMLMNDPRLENVPKILETEKSDDMHEDIENMNVLRSLISGIT